MSLTDTLFHSEEMDEIFSDTAHLTALLEFEAALARAEAKVGLFPEAYAAAIASRCQPSLYDVPLLKKCAAQSGNVAIPLVRQLTELVSEENRDAAGFVHWGATSQDAIDTAAMLQAQRALGNISHRLREIARVLVDLSGRHRQTLMVARTWMQQALPTTFGFVVAGWLDAVLRDAARLAAMKERVLALQFGGAVGTLAALHGRGLDVAQRLSEELHLPLPAISWHAQRDRIAELASTLLIFTGTLAKIARDVSLHAQTEVGELSEAWVQGRGGSSTMPHKRNPVHCAAILANAQRINALAGLLIAATPSEYQRGLGTWQAEWETLPELFRLIGGAFEHATALLGGLQVHADRMLANLEATNGLIFAEAVSVALGDRMGKMPAHLLLESACKTSISEGKHLKLALQENPNLRGHLTPADLDALFAARNYIGSGDLFITQVLQNAARFLE